MVTVAVLDVVAVIDGVIDNVVVVTADGVVDVVDDVADAVAVHVVGGVDDVVALVIVIVVGVAPIVSVCVSARACAHARDCVYVCVCAWVGASARVLPPPSRIPLRFDTRYLCLGPYPSWPVRGRGGGKPATIWVSWSRITPGACGLLKYTCSRRRLTLDVWTKTVLCGQTSTFLVTWEGVHECLFYYS